MSGISTHVVDTARGRPAAGIQVQLEIHEPGFGWHYLNEDVTNTDGHIVALLGTDQPLESTDYRLVFKVRRYFEDLGVAAFHPEVAVAFTVDDPSEHYHVPLLLGPFGYTTHRGT